MTLPYEDLPPQIGDHYCMALAHRKRILEVLPSGGKMLEWGSGNSTLWFRANMQLDQRLVSIEFNPDWAKLTGATCCRYRPGKMGTRDVEQPKVGWKRYVDAPSKDGPFDVILIDGPMRNECLKAARKLLTPGGTVFLHDAQRDWYTEGKQGWREVATHQPQPDYPIPALWEAKVEA